MTEAAFPDPYITHGTGVKNTPSEGHCFCVVVGRVVYESPTSGHLELGCCQCGNQGKFQVTLEQIR